MCVVFGIVLGERKWVWEVENGFEIIPIFVGGGGSPIPHFGRMKMITDTWIIVVTNLSSKKKK